MFSKDDEYHALYGCARINVLIFAVGKAMENYASKKHIIKTKQKNDI